MTIALLGAENVFDGEGTMAGGQFWRNVPGRERPPVSSTAPPFSTWPLEPPQPPPPPMPWN